MFPTILFRIKILSETSFQESRIISNVLLVISNTFLTLSSVVLVVVRAVTNRMMGRALYFDLS